jgi:hypothetical protein
MMYPRNGGRESVRTHGGGAVPVLSRNRRIGRVGRGLDRQARMVKGGLDVSLALYHQLTV